MLKREKADGNARRIIRRKRTMGFADTECFMTVLLFENLLFFKESIKKG